MFWLLVGRLLSPFGLVDVLISLAVLFLVIGVESLIIFCLYCFAAVIVRIENDNGIIVGRFHLFQCVSLTLGINADTLLKVSVTDT